MEVADPAGRRAFLSSLTFGGCHYVHERADRWCALANDLSLSRSPWCVTCGRRRRPSRFGTRNRLRDSGGCPSGDDDVTDSAAASVVQNLIQEVFDKSLPQWRVQRRPMVTDCFEGFRDDESVDVGAGPHFESLIRRIVILWLIAIA